MDFGWQVRITVDSDCDFLEHIVIYNKGVYMKFTFYVRNAFGIKEDFINIDPVSFFVGENSTGKTSYLILLYSLLTNGIEYRNIDFIGNSFSEIKSKNAASKLFRLGLFVAGKNNQCIVVDFKDSNGFPVIYQCAFRIESFELKIRITDKFIFYKITHIDSKEGISDSEFRQWAIDITFNDNYTRINHDLTNMNSLLFHIVDHLIKIKKYEDITKITKFSSEGVGAIIPCWIAPIRSKPLKVYGEEYSRAFDSEGRNIPYLLKEQVEKRLTKTTQMINKFGKDSGMFDSIAINKYDKSGLGPFSIEVIKQSIRTNIKNVGYGVSQILPILFYLFAVRNNAVFFIQQPEVHLHPKAQAALGELLFELAKENRHTFLIETHSEYLIDRYRVCLNKSTEIKVDSKVLYYEKQKGENAIFSIRIDDKGKYEENQPSSFRDFFINEAMSQFNII